MGLGMDDVGDFWDAYRAQRQRIKQKRTSNTKWKLCLYHSSLNGLGFP